MWDAWFRREIRPVWRLTARSRTLIVVLILILAYFSKPLLIRFVTGYIVKTDPPAECRHLVLENWEGKPEIFLKASEWMAHYRQDSLAVVVLQHAGPNPIRESFFRLSAWSVGLDTNKLTLIPVLSKEPKTWHCAVAVSKFASRNGWRHFAVITPELHSARSGEAYRKAADRFGIKVSVIGIAYEEVSAKGWPYSAVGWASAFSEFIKKLYYDWVLW